MILKLFSDDRVISAFFIGLFSLVMWTPSFLSLGNLGYESETQAMPFFILVDDLFEKHIILSRIVAFLFLALQAFMIVRINARYVLIQQRTFLPAFFFMVLVSFFPSLLNLSSFIFGNLFILLMLEIIFSVYKTEANSYRFFESGLLIAISSLFYTKLILFLPFLWIVSLILRPFYWREWLFPVLGLIVPYFIVFSLLFFVDQYPASLFVILFDSLFQHTNTFQLNWPNIVFTGFIFALIIISSIYMLKVFQFRKVFIRNYYLTLFWFSILGFVIFIFFSGFEVGMIYILAIPLSFIFSNYFINSRDILIKNILFVVFMILAMAGTVFHEGFYI
jgi:hypothetical protein